MTFRRTWLAAVVVLIASAAEAQPSTCPPASWSLTRLQALKADGFKIPDTMERHELAVALTACLGHADPAVRDGIAFEALSSWMRGGLLDQQTLQRLRGDLLKMLAAPDPDGFRSSFAALVLSEVARTDRLRAWMTTEERDELTRAAIQFLAGVKDHRAFNDTEGFRHAVAHAADVALQLVLNPLVGKDRLQQLMMAVVAQVAPDDGVAYWAGEPDRLARPIVFIAQRKLFSDVEWQAFFAEVTNPKPLASWQVAFTSERGIKKRHNVRAFLLSVYASATSSEDAGVRQLIGPVTAALKAVP